jgi:hypothetical protein
LKKIDGLYKTVDNPSKLQHENKEDEGKRKENTHLKGTLQFRFAQNLHHSHSEIGLGFQSKSSIIIKKHKSKGNQKTKTTKQPMV